jgi:hypothetical protein
MSEELKGNMCLIEFECMAQNGAMCVYGNNKIRCIHEKQQGFCFSSIARTNAMVIELKKMGVDVILTGRLDEIKEKLRVAVNGHGLKPVEDVLKILEEMR